MMFATTLFTVFLSASLHITQAINVFIYPPPSYVVAMSSLDDTSAAIMRHLGLERFASLRDASDSTFTEEVFVGQGLKSALLFTMDEIDARALLPKDVWHTVKHIPTSEPVDSLASVVSTYLHYARSVYPSIFSSDVPWQLTDVQSLITFFESTDEPAFAAFELKKLQDLRLKYGSSSPEYTAFSGEIHDFLDDALDHSNNLNLVILTFGSSLERRQAAPQQSQTPLPGHPPPQEPIGSISTCFTSQDACNNGTSSCSGRGQCVEATKAGRSCFVCTCSATKTGTGTNVKTDTWVGRSCERKDISGPFTLLTGTVIVLLLVVIGSISLLYSVGDQPLPSILLATAVTSKKD